MRGDLLDVLLALAAVMFAVSGYRRGFVVGVLSFAGFLVGGVLGGRLAPQVAELAPLRSVDPTVIAVATVLVAALIGQAVATAVGGRLRARLTWRPARLLDAGAGAAISMVSVLLVAWLIGTALAASSFPVVASQVRRSMVIGAVDRVLPPAARSAFDGLRQFVDERGFPEVFGRLTPTLATGAAPPDAALAVGPAVVRARPSVLKVTGVAPSCSRGIEGSGFLYAPHRVMTNAHVVAGVRDPVVQAADGSRTAARVVLYDPSRDIAVLAVPGLTGTPLGFSGPAAGGSNAVVVGFPQDGPFRADAARIRETQRAQGPDIYGNGAVVREVYALRGLVQPGNSGGPLLDPAAGVLGVVFAAAADRTDTGYALTAAEVAPDAAAGRTATARVGTQGCD